MKSWIFAAALLAAGPVLADDPSPTVAGKTVPAMQGSGYNWNLPTKGLKNPVMKCDENCQNCFWKEDGEGVCVTDDGKRR